DGPFIDEPVTPPLFVVAEVRLAPPAGCPSAKSAATGAVGNVCQTSTRLFVKSATKSAVPSIAMLLGLFMLEPLTPPLLGNLGSGFAGPAGWPNAKSAA